MEKSAKTISQRKFQKLSIHRQHRLLVELAADTINDGNIEAFLLRYHELHAWAQLDRYEPPAWLSIAEALEEFRLFHDRFCIKTGGPQLPALPLNKLSWQPKMNVEVVLDQVRSPYNVGSVLRLIDNFGFKRLVHSSSWLRLDHPRLRRAARGAEAWIPVKYEADLPAYLSQAPVPVVAIENDTMASPAGPWKPPKACILVLGNESYGIASIIRQHCSKSVYIPMYGFKKSMNIHHALAVVGQKIVEASRPKDR